MPPAPTQRPQQAPTQHPQQVPGQLPRQAPPPPQPPRDPSLRTRRPPPAPPSTPSTARRPKPAAPRPASAPPPAGETPKKPKRRWIKRTLALLLALLLVAAGGLVAGTFWVDQKLNRIPALTAYPDRPAAADGVTWLLVGSDSRQTLSEAQQNDLATGGDMGDGRTDTMLLVHLPGLGSDTPATMVSIPRDSYLEIPGYGSDKINAAFALGGAALLAQTVEQATGLRLDHYVEVGFGGFAELVDALGGVTLCPAEPIDDPLAGINLPAGCQDLDGRSALGFVRSRATPRADLDRMVNQRAFLSAILAKAQSPSTWLNPGRWFSAPQAAVNALTVDENARAWDLARLGWSLRDAVTVTVPIGQLTWSSSGDVVIWDDEAAAALFAALGADQPIPQSVLDAQP
ncbi:LCP family protein [Mycolicibacterium brumae]|uniref:LCP family protein n=1 Tax=Mycolicibacterium brumae TaxID=85968 RepID=UPI003B8A90F2